MRMKDAKWIVLENSEADVLGILYVLAKKTNLQRNMFWRIMFTDPTEDFKEELSKEQRFLLFQWVEYNDIPYGEWIFIEP